MEARVKKIIRELGVHIIYDSELDDDGHYVPGINIITINSRLSEFDQMKTLLHELGHACLHHDKCELYQVTFAMHSSMEKEANSYMIGQLLNHYTALPEFELSSFNYLQFIEDNELDVSYAPIIQEIIFQYACDSSHSFK